MYTEAKTDIQLQEDVLNELKWDASLTAGEISVTTNNGVITLRGSVPHFSQKMKAEKAARRVLGVRAVADELEVDLSDSAHKSDTEIAIAALNALNWNYSVPDGIQVTVDHGWLQLSGDVDWNFERTAAYKAVSVLMGVEGVTNRITLRARVKTENVKARIDEALARFSKKMTDQIHVSCEDGRVTLTGVVGTPSEMNRAENAAWNAPGVVSVENKIAIS